MPDRKGALILSHLQQEGACTLGSLLIERGIRVKTINTPRLGAGHIDALRPDLLIIMGGPIGVYQADDYPFLHDEMQILKARIAADLPTIGICLGSQLMAQAAGSKVRKAKRGKELGWHPLSLTEEGKNSPAKHIDASQTNMFHWHGDTFDLPDTATRLAFTEKYENQIYSIGKNALGLQCHPEVQAEQLEEWMVMFNRDVSGENAIIPLKALRAETTANIEALNRQAKLFFSEWLDARGL